MYFVFILYSPGADRFYIGHSDDPGRRLEEHNTLIKNSYTCRCRPWILKAKFAVSGCRGESMKAKFLLKRLKSRRSLKRLIENPERFEKIKEKVRAVPPFAILHNSFNIIFLKFWGVEKVKIH